MKKSLWASALLAAALIPAVTSCQETKRGEYAEGAGTIYCDEGFKSVLDEEIEVFEYSYPKSSIIPYYVNETDAINKLLEDKTQAIVITQELTKEQIKYLKSKFKRVARQKCIAVDAVALIANKDNPVGQLSMEEIRDIVTGKIYRWDQLAGSDTTHIKLVFDNEGSSTVSYLRDKFIGPNGKITDTNKNAMAVKTNSQVFDFVKKDKSALGVISVTWLGEDLGMAKKVPVNKRMEEYKVQGDTISTTLTESVNIIKVSNPCESNDFNPVGYKPYQAYIASGEYPLYRKVYMISTAPNSTVMHSFYSFITGPVGQKIITLTGILPFNMQPMRVNLVDRNSNN